MTETCPNCVHLARFGMATESVHLSQFRDSYDLLVFNANTVAHMPGAVARLVSEGTAKPFIVDPQTHAFQHDPAFVKTQNAKGEWSLKKSVDKLADVYGSVIRAKAGQKAVVPTDISDAVAAEIAEGVVRFQMLTVAEQDVSEENREYLDWMGLDITTPAVIVAPYFYMDARTIDQWLPVNILLAQKTAAFVHSEYEGTGLFLELVVDRDVLLDPDAVDAIATGYGDADCSGVLLWVDGLTEQEAPKKMLSGFAGLARSLRGKGKAVYNLYGGYFSILLAHPEFGGLLSGVCHGMEYGESRAVVPVGGGIPMAKYYVPFLHQRLRYGDAARLFFERGLLDSTDAFYARVCGCNTCREVLANDPQKNFALFGEGKPVTFRRRGAAVTLSYPNQDTKGRCLSHYLERKATEFNAMASSPAADLLSALVVTADEYEGDLGVEGVSHLRVWHSVLSSLL